MIYFANQPKINSDKARGYSLVEVLVAITVLLVALVGPLTIAQAGLKRAINSREQTMATFLAQEGIEAVVKLREDNALNAYPEFDDLNTVWNTLTALNGDCTASQPCGVLIGNDGAVTDTSFYHCNATNCLMRYTAGDRVPYRQNVTTGAVTNYERRIQLDVTNDRVIVTSTVTWGARPDQRVTMQTYVYNIYYAVDIAPISSTPPEEITVLLEAPYEDSDGPRQVLKQAIETSCGNCGMTSLAGSPNNTEDTRVRVCHEMFGSGSTVKSYYDKGYSSPHNNYIFTWTGSVWENANARDAGNNFVQYITCLVPR